MITATCLRELLDYDPSSGVFRWKKLPHKSASVQVGDIAGCLENTGYRRIGIAGRRYQEHQLAWMHVHGVWPENQIDHIDASRANNALANLRMASPARNRMNSKVHSNNFLGAKGVQLHKTTGKYRARIFVGGRHKSLGLYSKIEDAKRAYEEAAKEYFGEFARAA